MPRREDVERFYRSLDDLRRALGGPRRLCESDAKSGWPSHGVYFFFEPGEMREEGAPRVVRVGTHGLTATSRTKLWGRLSQHRGQRGGTHAGGGNHRGSIFRLHVGAAMSARDPGTAVATWGVGSTAPAGARAEEHHLESLVSRYIGSMDFIWLSVPDRLHRAYIERGSITLLSNSRKPPIDPPSPGWLGWHAQRAAIVESGLWNVNHVDEPCDAGFLDRLEERVLACQDDPYERIED